MVLHTSAIIVVTNESDNPSDFARTDILSAVA